MDNNYIFQYWEAIQNGTVTVGKWIKTIYEILVNGLKVANGILTRKRPIRL